MAKSRKEIGTSAVQRIALQWWTDPKCGSGQPWADHTPTPCMGRSLPSRSIDIRWRASRRHLQQSRTPLVEKLPPLLPAASRLRSSKPIPDARIGPKFLALPCAPWTRSAWLSSASPPTYGETGERREQSGVYFIRLAANLQLPAGEHTLLLRAPGMARLTIGEVEVALLGPAHIVRDAHGTLRERPERPYLRPRMGTSEREISYHSDGRDKTVLLEALVGDSGGKIQVGELLLAAKLGGASQWVLPSPGPAEILFTPLAAETYKQRERTHQDELNTSLRRELASRTAQDWKQRHDLARAFIKTLPPLREPQIESRSESGSDNAIDRFLHAKINSSSTRNTQPKTHFQSRVYPLLEEHCFRCHGRKKKGGLRLDSRPAVLAGGDSGPALVPHQPSESDLLTRVSSRDQDLRMPPRGERLTREQQASLKQWIEGRCPLGGSRSRSSNARGAR